MKKIGIIGGLGPESTLDYYRGIINLFKPIYSTSGFPEIIIESLELNSFVKLAENNEWEKIITLLSKKFDSLQVCGADFGVIASNSPHKVFDEIQKRTTLPLISIVNATCTHISNLNIKKVGLLGTKFTMASDFYAKKLDEYSIQTFVPDSEDIDYIQQKLMTEIELGIVKEETKAGIIAIIDKLLTNYTIDGLILGCTELPLIIKQHDIKIHYIDTAKIHIENIVAFCRN